MCASYSVRKDGKQAEEGFWQVLNVRLTLSLILCVFILSVSTDDFYLGSCGTGHS